MPSDFDGAFAALREIMRKHSAGMLVQTDSAEDYTLLSPALGPNGKPMWFGAVQVGRSAVSFHLMPLYFNPKLQAMVSPELAKRKQGKTCFNFQRPDAALFGELDELVREGRAAWDRAGFLTPGPVSKETMEAALRAGGEDPGRIARERTRAATARRKGRRGDGEKG